MSTVKAEKVRPILGKLHTLKPNRLEAELLSGVAIRDLPSARQAAGKLLETGLQRVFISLGTQGVFAADHTQTCGTPCCPAQVRSATGAGDAFAAALAWAFLEGSPWPTVPGPANAAASIAVEGEKTINPALSADAASGAWKNRRSRYEHFPILTSSPRWPRPSPRQARGGPGVHHHLPRHALSPERGDRLEGGGDHPGQRGHSRHHRPSWAGRLKAGLTPEEIEYLGKQGQKVTKASRRDLSVLVAQGADGATTVGHHHDDRPHGGD